MTATAHALIGGAIAASIQNPPLGIILSAATHPIVDLIPHWDFGWGWRKKKKLTLFLEASFDLAVGVILAYFIFGLNVNLWYFLSCILASIMWDVMEAPYLLLGWKVPPFSWVYNVQHKMQGKAKLPWGILTQATTVIAFVLILEALHPFL